MVGIVHKIRFTPSNSATFSGYIDYIDRDEATRNYSFKDFSLYNDYMGNPKKSGSLFTSDKDFLSSQETKILKENFKLAQKKGSIMWQDVFSFDNKWLEQQGLYNAKSHTVDEKKIMSAVRSTMAELMKKEKLDSLVWSASFHYNTDNIHVHVASVELNNPKERGFRKNSTREMMKSKFANVLLDRSNENKKINDLIRNNIINKKEISLLNDKEIKRLTLEIIKRLPSDKKQWSYGYNSINDAKPFIDKITKYYLENYKKEEFKTLILELNKEKNFYKEVYGEREDKSIKSFEE
ncbi:MobP2 family relaxase, partial [Cetobacterium sp.]|uniref:MobP2 family relaxase n=1 Tax=Cetobacterium sp. TaxID=2071632 RepID=UPI002FC67ECB